MTVTELDAIKSKLERNIDRLRKQVEDLEEATKPISPENAIGRVSRMDAINNKSVNEAALRAARVKLTQSEDAYTRLEDENFGICVQCKKPIDPPRLLFMPESKYCMKCVRR